MCQVEEHEILLFVGKNDLNQSENIRTSNIFISFLFHTYMRIDRINPTIELTASNAPQLIQSCSRILIIGTSYHPLVIIFVIPFGFDQKHCQAIVWITGTTRQLIAFSF